MHWTFEELDRTPRFRVLQVIKALELEKRVADREFEDLDG